MMHFHRASSFLPAFLVKSSTACEQYPSGKKINRFSALDPVTVACLSFHFISCSSPSPAPRPPSFPLHQRPYNETSVFMIIRTEYIPLLQVSFLPCIARFTQRQIYNRRRPSAETGNLMMMNEYDETGYLQHSGFLALQLIHSRTIQAIPSKATGNSGILDK